MRAAATAVLGAQPAVPIVDPLQGFTKHRVYNTPIARALAMEHDTCEVGKRIARCAERIGLLLELPDGGEVAAHLASAKLCRARLCPFCEWRRTRAWRARTLRGLAQLQAERPTYRAIFLTLTVRNCPIGELRSTIDDMHRSWKRLTKMAEFPTALWLRRTEVTISRGAHPPHAKQRRGREAASLANVPGSRRSPRSGPGEGDADITIPASVLPLTAHPHLHCLLVVPARYFKAGYIRQTRWQQLWWEAARLDYAPVVDVRNVYQRGDDSGATAPPVSAVCEAAKYITKAADLVALGEHLPELHRQLRGVKMIATSGALRPYVGDQEPEGDELLDTPDGSPCEGLAARVAAVWDEGASAYRFDL